MMIVGCGFTGGAAAGGLISSWLIPHFGWRVVFVLGGILPLAVAAAMWRLLPESPQFHHATSTRAAAAPIVGLFRDGRAGTTVRLWAIDFLTLLNLYFLSNWLPTIAQASGHAVSDAVLVGAVLQIGGMIGTLVFSWVVPRLGFASALSLSFLAAGGSIALLGVPALSLGLLFALVFVAGFCVVGGQPAVIAMAGSYYPTQLRSTGIGWVLGIGRVGAIAGPVLAGELMRLDWSAGALFRAAAVPAVVSAGLMYSLRSAVTKSPDATTHRDVELSGVGRALRTSRTR